MTSVFILQVFSFFIFLLKPTGAFPQSGLDSGGNRTRRDVPCRADLEYPNGNICCLNCPAGTFMRSPCTRAGEKGKCEECNNGTYTEHANGLKQCFKCTNCRSDQVPLRLCISTQDTECQCKSGGFCAPDQACEVCKKCSRCEKDEEIVRNCTATTNTVCKKIQPNSGSASTSTAAIVAIVLISGLIIGIVFFVWKRCRATEFQRNLPDGMKAGQHNTESCPTEERRSRESQRPSCPNWLLVRARTLPAAEDERNVLCGSLNSSASNSQHSLTSLHSTALTAALSQASPMVPWQLNRREDEKFPKLFPVNGEESLRKCFEYLEELEVDYHKRFFRHLGLSDNVVKSKEGLTYEDKIHELLNVWIEKEGREASLNDLLKVLLDLNQRRTAEAVKERAIHDGHYRC